MQGLQAGVEIAQRFVLIQRLGAGGLAEVWTARDKETGTEVAIKLLHKHLATDRSLVERFKRELAVTRELHHPGIVRVFDLHEHEGRPFFSMELLVGESLADRMRAGPLPQEEARRIAREVAVALQCAHRAGVVHRDLKPANILLLKDGRAKLLDFGLARAAGWSRQTAQSTVMGTPGYIAPEMLTGKGVDARADLYALGATLFEMLTGKRAFPGADAFATLRAKGEAPPSARALDPRLDAELDAVVQRALQSDVEKRFLDAGQMLRALDGEQLPLAPTVPMTLTAGDCNVVVQQGMSRYAPGGGKAIERVIARLGAPAPSLGWSLRMRLLGKQVLVAGTNRAQAEIVVALCQAEGLTAQIVPAKARGRLGRWLERKGGRISAAFATAIFFGALGNLTSNAGLFSEKTWAGTAVAYLLTGIGHSPLPALLGLAGLLASRMVLDRPPLSEYADDTIKPVSSWRAIAWRTAMAALGTIAFTLSLSLLTVTLSYHRRAADAAVLADDTARERAIRAEFLAAGETYSQAWHTARKQLWPAGLWPAGSKDPFLGAGVFGAFLAGVWTSKRRSQKRLLRGDPAVRRLADGIALRVTALRARLQQAAPASRMLLEELFIAADQAEVEARRLADLAAEVVEPLGVAAPVALPLSAMPGVDERDRAVDRLLEIAAGLDDALAGIGAAQLDEPTLIRLQSDLVQPPPVSGEISREVAQTSAKKAVDR